MKRFPLFYLLIFCSCASVMIGGNRGEFYQSKLYEKNDEFDNTKITCVNLAMHSFKLLTELGLGFEKITHNDQSKYVMKSYIYRNSWLFVDTVKIKIDNKLYTFESIKQNRNVLDQGYVEELCYYNVDRKFIKNLTYGNNIEIRFYGKNNFIPLDYEEEHRTLLAQFINKTK